jgi:holo-[acyl-carrier protein] synthase
MVLLKSLSDSNNMIEKLGVGIDIADITDFKKNPYQEKPGFYQLIFQSSEIDYCLKFQDSSSHFAGKFALKEAVKKSINDDIYISKIETFHVNSKPMIKLLDSAKKYVFRASISHEGNYAIAIVISELIN